MRFLFVTLISFLCIGCTSKKVDLPQGPLGVSLQSVKELESYRSINLAGKTIPVKDKLILGASDLMLLDKYLIFTKFYAQPHYLNFVSLENPELEIGFLREGGGPGEYAGLLTFFLADVKNRIIGVLPRGYGSRYSEISLDSILTHPSYLPKTKITFDMGVGLMNMRRINDDQFVALAFRSKKHLSLFDGYGQKVNEFLEYPFGGKMDHISESALAMVFQSKLVSNSQTNQVAVFSMASPNWDIVTITDSELALSYSTHLAVPEVTDKSTQNGKETKKSIAFSTKNKEGFIDVASTSKYIFALYSGKSYAEVGADIAFSDQLLVLNWKGNLILKLQLDKKVKAITASAQNEIYALVEGQNSSSVRKYDLSDFLE